MINHTFNKSLGIFEKNQKISATFINYKDAFPNTPGLLDTQLLRITPLQTVSTPGIKCNNICLLPGTSYEYTVVGCSNYNQCLLWVFDTKDNKRFSNDKIMLPVGSALKPVSMTLHNNTSSSITVSIGVLFTSEFPSDAVMYIQSILFLSKTKAQMDNVPSNATNFRTLDQEIAKTDDTQNLNIIFNTLVSKIETLLKQNLTNNVQSNQLAINTTDLPLISVIDRKSVV